MKFLPTRIRDIARSEARSTQYYKSLTKRSFRHHANYPDYKTIMTDIAAYLMTADTGVIIKAKEHDPAYIGMLHSAYMVWKNPSFPVYAIKPDLANAFMHTQTPTHVCRMNKMFDIALFLLPSDLIKNPDNSPCEWLLITQFEPGDIEKYNPDYRGFLAKITGINEVKIDIQEGLNAGENKLRWATNISGLYSYTNVMALPKNSDHPITGAFISRGFSSLNLETEVDFTNKINSLVLQTMLYMQLPKQVEDLPVPTETTSIHRTHGFDPNSPKEPIWIGLEYRERTIKKQHLGGSHASPVTHWRRGHWRNAGNATANEPRITWIRPTIVNG